MMMLTVPAIFIVVFSVAIGGQHTKYTYTYRAVPYDAYPLKRFNFKKDSIKFTTEIWYFYRRTNTNVIMTFGTLHVSISVRSNAPTILLVVPAGQLRHVLLAFAPSAVLYVPARQLVHVLPPSAVLYDPAGQVVHVADPSVAYDPAKQF
jgi:hypothetical protein